MKTLLSALCLAVSAMLLQGCPATAGEPHRSAEPPSGAAFQYPYNPRW
jgi:hypothetical protein